MSSEQRASSAVRNLRSMFENKTALDPSNNSPNTRGRSPGVLNSDKENGDRPTSKVRASFVPVGPAVKMATPTVERRGSFSEADADHELRKTVSQQQESKDGSENAIESAVGTPLRKADEGPMPAPDDSPLAAKADQPPANPDKPVTAAEEEPGEMKPADPTDEQGVSGGEALPPVAEDLRASTQATAPSSNKKPTTNGKPSAISTKPTSKPISSAVKSPASQPKTPPAAKIPSKKASRSSLTAPTAASMARTGPGADKSTDSKTSSHATKKREPTKPSSLPSHLTAPTASSRAKHDAASALAATAATSKSTTTSRAKPTSSTRPTQRTSLAPAHRPESQTSHTSAPRRSLAASDSSSFLERMMKPTAASASKTHEKPDVKSPPSKAKAPASKPKTNGNHSKPKTAEPSVQSTSAAPAVVPEEENKINGAEPKDPPSEQSHEVAGNETPLQNSNGAEATDAALEATPAGLAGEETIR